MESLLLHACCGPCLIYPYEKLKKEFKVSVFYYNPNIHPLMEYIRRVETFIAYCRENSINFTLGDYDPAVYFASVGGDKAGRCELCYMMRLEETARKASEKGYDAFSTTLLVSPYQKHEIIKDTGKKLADKYGLEFIYIDFREGFKEAQDKAKEIGLYRQPYCGCIYSEYERYEKKLRKTIRDIE